MTLVLGIDPGTAATGFGLVRSEEDDRLVAIAFGVLQTPANEALPQRLLLLYQQLNQLLLLHRPQAVAVEKLFFQRNVSTAIAVGQARGVVLLAAAQAGLPVFEYTPNEVKQAVAGYGSAQKRQVQEMIRVLLNLPAPPRPDDAADALAVAITHLSTKRFV